MGNKTSFLQCHLYNITYGFINTRKDVFKTSHFCCAILERLSIDSENCGHAGKRVLVEQLFSMV